MERIIKQLKNGWKSQILPFSSRCIFFYLLPYYKGFFHILMIQRWWRPRWLYYSLGIMFAVQRNNVCRSCFRSNRYLKKNKYVNTFAIARQQQVYCCFYCYYYNYYFGLWMCIDFAKQYYAPSLGEYEKNYRLYQYNTYQYY